MEEKRVAVGGGGGSGVVEGAGPGGPVLAWTPSLGPGENTSETESIESRESAKSRDTSPSHSPPVSVKAYSSIYPPEVNTFRQSAMERILPFVILRILSQTWIRTSPNVRCLKLHSHTSSKKCRLPTSVGNATSMLTSTVTSALNAGLPLTRNGSRHFNFSVGSAGF